MTRTARAVAIRDHALPLIRSRGAIKPVGEVRVVLWQAGPLSFLLRTPFSNWPKAQPAPSYEAAIALQKAKPLPYCLDVFRGRKVMSFEWSDDGACNLISFKPGEWVAETLALS